MPVAQFQILHKHEVITEEENKRRCVIKQVLSSEMDLLKVGSFDNSSLESEVRMFSEK